MMDLFNNVLLQHGLVGFVYGFVGAGVLALKFLFHKGFRKTFAIRVLQGAVTGHVLALANHSIFQVFELSLGVSAVLGFVGGLVGLVFAQAIADKIAKQLGLDLKEAEKNLTHNIDVLDRLNVVKETEVNGLTLEEIDKKIATTESEIAKDKEV